MDIFASRAARSRVPGGNVDADCGKSDLLVRAVVCGFMYGFVYDDGSGPLAMVIIGIQ